MKAGQSQFLTLIALNSRSSLQDQQINKNAASLNLEETRL